MGTIAHMVFLHLTHKRPCLRSIQIASKGFGFGVWGLFRVWGLDLGLRVEERRVKGFSI